ncbi:hypothetical protein FXO38_09261 [Capsicum annuum]|uniref:Uncharacterized protein n=1 Tax=Capsicum annuum TaxID=4072 RepID=A0A2G3A7T8_CAPAN|nr:hypothetical protein FXO38_09261 [Capsicum annuum]PHT90261.1 hypothetical protein T459_05374 [Capsicum annuum]
MMLNVNVADVIISLTEVGHAANILTPDPLMSDFDMPGLFKNGPLEEKAATVGVWLSLILIPLNDIVATGVDVDFILNNYSGLLLNLGPVPRQTQTTRTGRNLNIKFMEKVNRDTTILRGNFLLKGE